MSKESIKNLGNRDVLSPEFVTTFREKLATHMEDYITSIKAPLDQDVLDIPKKIREGQKMAINSWTGDAFANICIKDYRLTPEEYDKLLPIFLNGNSSV